MAIDIEKFRKEANDRINGRLGFTGWIGAMLEFGAGWAANLILPGDSEDAFNDWLRGERAEKNAGYIIESFGIFVNQIYETPSLRDEFPAFAKHIDQASVYLDNPSVNDIALELYAIAFNPLSTSGGLYLPKGAYELLEEYMNGINGGYVTLFLSPPKSEGEKITTREQLWNLIPGDKTEFADVTTSTYIALDTALYAINNFRASLFYTYHNAKFVRENLLEIQQSENITLYASCLQICYPCTDNIITMYYDETTHEIVPDRPETGYYEEIKFKEFDANGGFMESVLIDYTYTPHSYQYVSLTPLDANGSAIKSVFVTDSNVGSASYLKNISFRKSKDMLVFDFKDDYHKEIVPKLHGDWSGAVSRFYNLNTNRLDTLFTWNTTLLDELKAINGINIEFLIQNGNTKAVDRPDEKTLIDEGYQSSYENGGVSIVDKENGDVMFIPGLSDSDIRGVIQGDKNITDVMNKDGIFAVDKDNNVIESTGSQTPENKPDAPKTDDIDYGGNVAMPRGLVSTYVLSLSEINRLGQKLYDPNFFDSLQRIFADPIQSIIGVGFIPFQIDGLAGPVDIMIGNQSTGISAHRVTNQYITLNFGSVGPSNLYGGADTAEYYEPYAEYTLYVPYCGWQPIPASVAVGGVSVIARVDVMTGDMTASIYSFPDATDISRQLPVITMTGNCFRSFPISQSSGSAIFNATAKAVGGVATIGAMAVNPMAGMAVGSIASSMAPGGIAPTVTTVGGISGNTGYTGPQRLVMYARRKRITKPGDSFRTVSTFGHIRGSLGDETNIYRYSNVTLPMTSDMTREEAQKIKQILLDGVV